MATEYLVLEAATPVELTALVNEAATLNKFYPAGSLSCSSVVVLEAVQKTFAVLMQRQTE